MLSIPSPPSFTFSHKFKIQIFQTKHTNGRSLQLLKKTKSHSKKEKEKKLLLYYRTYLKLYC